MLLVWRRCVVSFAFLVTTGALCTLLAPQLWPPGRCGVFWLCAALRGSPPPFSTAQWLQFEDGPRRATRGRPVLTCLSFVSRLQARPTPGPNRARCHACLRPTKLHMRKPTVKRLSEPPQPKTPMVPMLLMTDEVERAQDDFCVQSEYDNISDGDEVGGLPAAARCLVLNTSRSRAGAAALSRGAGLIVVEWRRGTCGRVAAR